MTHRPWDPFSPPPARQHTSEKPAGREAPKGLDDMRKDALVALAATWELNTSGTRADLIGRIRAAAG